MANNLNSLGSLVEERDSDAAASYYERALRINEEIGDAASVAMNLVNLGHLASKRNDLDGAEDYASRALRTFEAQGHLEGRAVAIANLGEIAQKRGNNEGARERCEQALAILMEMGATDEHEYLVTVRRRLAELSEA